MRPGNSSGSYYSRQAGAREAEHSGRGMKHAECRAAHGKQHATGRFVWVHHRRCLGASQTLPGEPLQAACPCWCMQRRELCWVLIAAASVPCVAMLQLPRVPKQLLTVQKSCELTARPSSLMGNFTSQEPTMFWILNSLKVAWKPSLMMILQYCTRTSSVRQGIKDACCNRRGMPFRAGYQC